MQADDLAPALGVDGHGDYCGNADDPPAFAYLEIGGIEPEIRPTASISGLPPAKHSRVLNRAGIRFPVRTIPIQQEMDL
jgi:hypothetical protein